MEHILLTCPVLACVRNPLIDIITTACTSIYPSTNNPERHILLILDHSALLQWIDNPKSEQLQSLEFQCRRLCFSLLCER